MFFIWTIIAVEVIFTTARTHWIKIFKFSKMQKIFYKNSQFEKDKIFLHLWKNMFLLNFERISNFDEINLVPSLTVDDEATCHDLVGKSDAS